MKWAWQLQRIHNRLLLATVRVSDTGHKAFVSVHGVLDGLQAPVGEEDEVLSFGVVTVARFLVAEVVAAEVILHPILKVIRCGGLEEKRLEVVNVFGAQACARKNLLNMNMLLKPTWGVYWTHLGIRRVVGVGWSAHRHSRHREQQDDSLESERRTYTLD